MKRPMTGTRKRLLSSILVLVLFLSLSAPAFARMGILGDANMDYQINSEDARLALRLAVGLDELTEDLKKLCDADGDGKITSADARIILRVAVQLDTLNGKTVEISDTVSAPVETPEPSEQGSGAIVQPAVPAPDAPTLSPGVTPTVESPSGTFTVIAFGNGHGVGMTQHGAAFLAARGWNYRQILSYYYLDTKLVRDAVEEYTYYCGEYYATEELVRRIVYMEIAGITDDIEALKAQAVAVYTLIKKYDFYVTNTSQVGVASTRMTYASENLNTAVRETLGEYLARTNDSTNMPVAAVYSAMSGGKTISAYEAWGGGDYPIGGVYSLFDMDVKVSYDEYIKTYTYTVEEMRDEILKKNAKYGYNTALSNDPAQWVQILSHNASYNADIGYVQSISLGGVVYNGIYNCNFLGLRSACFTIYYTP